MTLEVEQKYRVPNRAELTQRITELGGRESESIAQSDRYYAHPSRSFKETDEALRVRTIGEESVITYKGPRQKTDVKTRREIELPLGDAAAGAEFAELLEILGFRPVATVSKRRTQYELDWQGRQLAIALDELGPAGQFCEIELCVEEVESAQAAQLVATLAEKLGLNEIERRSYLAMTLKDEGP